jgi:hypothetical protein
VTSLDIVVTPHLSSYGNSAASLTARIARDAQVDPYTRNRSPVTWERLTLPN